MSIPTSPYYPHSVAINMSGVTDTSDGFQVTGEFSLSNGAVGNEDINDAIIAAANALELHLTNLGWTVSDNSRHYTGNTEPIPN